VGYGGKHDDPSLCLLYMDPGIIQCYDLRHTYVRNARKAGVDRTVIMKLTGHKTLAM
jgi:integrase